MKRIKQTGQVSLFGYLPGPPQIVIKRLIAYLGVKSVRAGIQLPDPYRKVIKIPFCVWKPDLRRSTSG